MAAEQLLKKTVNSKEKTYKQEEGEIFKDYHERLKSANPKKQAEFEWCILECHEFISQGINPQKAYRKV